MLRRDCRKNNDKLSVKTKKGARIKKWRYLLVARRRAALSPLVEEASRWDCGFLRPEQERRISAVVLVVGQCWSCVRATEIDWRDQSRYTRRGDVWRLSSCGKPMAGERRNLRLTSRKSVSS